jgi:hypothetical protein
MQPSDARPGPESGEQGLPTGAEPGDATPPAAGPGSEHPAARRRPRPRGLWKEEPVSRWSLLRHKPRARAATALVLMTRPGDLLCFTADRQPTYSELFWSSAQTMYQVDMGRYRMVVSTSLPARGSPFEFTADLLLHWQVIRPVEAVRQNLWNPSNDLEQSMIHELRVLSRRHRVEEAAAAEADLNDQLQIRTAKTRLFLESDAPMDSAAEGEYLPGVAYGVLLTARVELRTDQKAVEIATVSRQIELETEKQKLRKLQEANNRELIDARIRYYREIIEQGEINSFALQIAQNPDDVATVIEAIRTQANTNRKQTIDFVSRLVESGAISAYQIEDQVREALDWLKAGTDRVIGKPIEVKGAEIPQRRRVESTVGPETDLPVTALPETGKQG